jgi:hypothetical protein
VFPWFFIAPVVHERIKVELMSDTFRVFGVIRGVKISKINHESHEMHEGLASVLLKIN